MISNKDLYDEIKKIDDVIAKDSPVSEDEYRRSNLKALTLLLKLAHNIRTNSVTVMKHFKIEFPKAKETEEEG